MKSSRSIGALCAATMFQMILPDAFAQESEADTNGAGLLEEIVVTSRRTEESLQDVPISITAYSSEDIVARRLADIEDIALNTPNVHFTRNLGLAIVAIRGFSDDEVVATADPLVGIYVDGVYVPRMQGALLETRVDLRATNTFLPTCLDVRDRRNVCERYEYEIRERGGVDLQILGIGANGHIGFNEPTSSLSSRTRVKTLTPQTVRDGSQPLERGKSKPVLAITMGIATILDARSIVLLAMGRAKAPAVAAAIEGPVSAMCPASSLQFHRDVTVITDADAAGELKYLEYYRSVHEIEKSLPAPESDAQT